MRLPRQLIAPAVLLVLFGLNLPALAAKVAAPPATNKAGAAVAAKLRTDWKMADLKMQREAVDDASFPAKLKQTGLANLDWYLGEQEKLLANAKQAPQNEAKLRAAQSKLDAAFKQKMAAIYGDPRMMAELNKRIQALNKELDTMAGSADKMFAHLDAVGLSPAQQAKLKPAVKDASQKLKQTVAKSPSGTTSDPATRDEVVDKYQQARQQVKQTLTPEQREKLSQRMAQQP